MISLQRLTLRQRLLLVVLLPTALLAAGIAGLFATRGTQLADQALHDRGLAIVSFLAPAAEYGVISGNRTTLNGLLQAVMEQRDVAAIAIYDGGGELLAFSGRLRLPARGELSDIDQARVMERGLDRLSLVAPVIPTLLVVSDLHPMEDADSHHLRERQLGWVHVELDTIALEHEKRFILLTTLAMVLAGLSLTAWLAVRMANAVSAPVSRLADAVNGMSQGQLDMRVAADAPIHELRALQSGFNSMAEAISGAHLTLQAKVDEATAQLAHQALHDPLTGLPNRRAFEQALEASVSASRRATDNDMLCFIDLDRFKIVNDTCGHAAGDELLRRIARLIRQRLRVDDLICRIGGDEFALILHGCKAEEARRIADQLCEAIASLRFTWDGRRFAVGASIGLVHIDGQTDSAADVLVAADFACYAAKKAGRNRVVEHSHALQIDRPTGIVTTPAACLEVIPYAQLLLLAQRIHPVRDQSEGSWHEILLRVQGEDGDLCVPADLLSRLDGSEAGLALDRWVAEQACALQYLAAQGSGDGYRFSLNVTRASLCDPRHYLDGLTASLNAHGLAPTQVVIEFPAEVGEQHPHESAVMAQTARELGCRIALERLHGGSAGLLRSLRPDYVKISFKALVESYGLEAGCNLAQALCGMATALSIPAVATEVEDELLHEALHEYGFAFAQGLALSSPQALQGHNAPGAMTAAPNA